jgi:hypothetical protein
MIPESATRVAYVNGIRVYYGMLEDIEYALTFCPRAFPDQIDELILEGRVPKCRVECVADSMDPNVERCASKWDYLLGVDDES